MITLRDYQFLEKAAAEKIVLDDIPDWVEILRKKGYVDIVADEIKGYMPESNQVFIRSIPLYKHWIQVSDSGRVAMHDYKIERRRRVLSAFFGIFLAIFAAFLAYFFEHLPDIARLIEAACNR